VLFLLLIPGAAPAQRVTAEQAIENHRRQLQSATGTGVRRAADCEPSSNPDEIVVCGRNDNERHRLPLPVEPVPGAPQRQLGELPTGGDALSAGGCLRLCHQPVQVDVIGAARGAARAIGRLLDPDS
jgi:hypothetical protein